MLADTVVTSSASAASINQSQVLCIKALCTTRDNQSSGVSCLVPRPCHTKECNHRCTGVPFISKALAQQSVADGKWTGGFNTSTLAAAELQGLGWYDFYKSQAPWGSRLTLRDTWVNTSTSPMGTCTGITKLPYMRDARRTIGIDGFVVKATDLKRNASVPLAVQPVGTVFDDRVAIGTFFFDLHELETQPTCYPKYIPHYEAYYNARDIRPYFLPLRALTNSVFHRNILYAGKSIATSYLVSSATRLHPVEWASGSAAGATAAFMVRHVINSTHGLLQPPVLRALQARTVQHTPLHWTLACGGFPQNASGEPLGGTAGVPPSGPGWTCA
eukprot:m.783143 g.783143  ORF g.783143 m.783143 type:complete len:330 (+) comp23292_c0_seq6:1547-2536(+)